MFSRPRCAVWFFFLRSLTDRLSSMTVCEQLKQLAHWCKKLSDKISSVLETQKAKLLNDPISINTAYKQLSYMSSYDFSDASIEKRITTL